jgi:hypothetical protein
MRPAVASLALWCLAGCVEPALPTLDPEAMGAVDAGPYRCSPMNCTGCCRNNICRGGNEDEACGYDGRLCQECPSEAMCVAPGTCVGRPNDAGTKPAPVNADAGLTNPFKDEPIPPLQRCVWVFGVPICS